MHNKLSRAYSGALIQKKHKCRLFWRTRKLVELAKEKHIIVHKKEKKEKDKSKKYLFVCTLLYRNEKSCYTELRNHAAISKDDLDNSLSKYLIA